MNVVIAGAGIAGLSVARALADRGFRPIVIGMDGGATAMGAGIVSSQFWDRALAPLAQRSRKMIRRLVPVHRCGMTQIALTERSAQLLDRIQGARDGIPVRLRGVLSPVLLRRVVRAVFTADDFWVSPKALLSSLADGINIVRAKVRHLREDRVTTDRGEFRADRLVVALGARMVRFVPRLDLHRAVLARISARVPTMFHILETGVYVRPDRVGSLVGDGEAPWVGLDRVLRHVGRHVSVARGVVALTRTRRPVVRRQGNMWFVAGLGGDGLALAPALGEMVAGEIQGSR